MEIYKILWKQIRLDGNRKKCERWITKIRLDKNIKMENNRQ